MSRVVEYNWTTTRAQYIVQWTMILLLVLGLLNVSTCNQCEVIPCHCWWWCWFTASLL